MMGIGILLICGGCALVGKRKTVPRRYMPGHYVAHRFLPHSRVKRRTKHTQLNEVAGPGLVDGGTKRTANGTHPVPDASVGVQHVQLSWS